MWQFFREKWMGPDIYCVQYLDGDEKLTITKASESFVDGSIRNSKFGDVFWISIIKSKENDPVATINMGIKDVDEEDMKDFMESLNKDVSLIAEAKEIINRVKEEEP